MAIAGTDPHGPVSQGSIIPPANAIRKLDLGLTRWVLVIEKEVGLDTNLVLNANTSWLMGLRLRFGHSQAPSTGRIQWLATAF